MHQKHWQSICVKISQIKALLVVINYLSLESFQLVLKLKNGLFLMGMSSLVSLGWGVQLPECIFVSIRGCDTVCAVNHVHLDYHGLIRFNDFSTCCNSELSSCAHQNRGTVVHVVAQQLSAARTRSTGVDTPVSGPSW